MQVNGNLRFQVLGSGELQNAIIERVSTLPATLTAGRIVYLTQADGSNAANLYYYHNGTTWTPFATGGNAAALQAEVDAIETSLGAGITSSGTFNAAGFVTTPALSTPTSFTDAINQIATYANANNELSELDDVTLTGLAPNDLLQYNGTAWVNRVIGSASGVQAYDAGLTNLAGSTDTGMVIQTGADTFRTNGTLVAPAAGLTITNANGVAGDPTFALANDLAALEGLTASGFAVRTGTDTWTLRAISGTAGRIVVLNPDGVSSSPTIDLETVTAASGGTFQKFTSDGYGRITAVSNVVTADITALVDSQYLRLDGTTTMTANLNVGGNKVVSLGAPTDPTDAANKAYVDALQNGLSWKQAVRAATTGNITLSGTQTVDGVALVAGNRVLVKDQTTASQNGIYVVAAGAWTRAIDMNDAAEFDGSAVFVQEGTVNEGTGWTATSTVTTVGTDPVAFSQFSGGQAFIWGVGLANTGNTVYVNLGSGIVEKPNDSVGIDLYDEANSALILTTDGTTREDPASNDGKLFLLLQSAGGLAQGPAGLRIPTAGVVNQMLQNPSVTIDVSGAGTSVLALGGQLLITGDASKGVSTAVLTAGTINGDGTQNVDPEIQITIADASSTQKGVATFSTNHFTVTAGNVELNASLDDLTNVSTADGAATGSLLQKTAGDWVAVSPATVAGGINLGDLADVGTAAPTNDHVLVGNGTSWNNQKVFHLYTAGAAATTHVVTHNIGQQFCNVTVIDDSTATKEVIIPQSIVFDDNNQLTVTLNTPLEIRVVVMGLA